MGFPHCVHVPKVPSARRTRALSIFSRRSLMLFAIDRSRSRSNVADPASAYSSSKATSPDSSDWFEPNVVSSMSLYWAWSSPRSASSRARKSASSAFVKGVLGAMVAGRYHQPHQATTYRGLANHVRYDRRPMAYRTIDAREPLPAVEARVLEFGRDAGVFQKSLELRAGAPERIFYEGPPTANGKPGIHHVESRTFKDVYPLFKPMTGHLVHR